MLILLIHFGNLLIPLSCCVILKMTLKRGFFLSFMLCGAAPLALSNHLQKKRTISSYTDFFFRKLQFQPLFEIPHCGYCLFKASSSTYSLSFDWQDLWRPFESAAKKWWCLVKSPCYFLRNWAFYRQIQWFLKHMHVLLLHCYFVSMSKIWKYPLFKECFLWKVFHESDVNYKSGLLYIYDQSCIK